MSADEIIMMLLEQIKNKPVTFDVSKDEAIEHAEEYLYDNGYRRDGLDGSTWIRENAY